MRIALCLEFPIGQHGGTETLVRELIKALASNHEIILISADAGKNSIKPEIAALIREHIALESKRSSVAAAKRLAQQIAAAKPDVAHFHSGGVFVWGGRFPFHCPIIYLDRLGVPCLSTVHRAVKVFEGYCDTQKSLWFKALMLPLAWTGKMQQLLHTRREVAVAQHALERLRRIYWPVKNRFTQIYHSRLHEEPARGVMADGHRPRPTGNFPREKIILNVGHLAKAKGQTVLAEAFAQIAPRHPDWTLQLAGYDATGIISRQIRQIIADKKLDKQIVLLGDREDAQDLMRTAAIYVQPSREEGMPLALQEAMYFGCAVIGSRINAHEELIQEAGLLFETGNATQLSAALEQLIENESRREQLSHAAAESIRARGMTAEQMTRNYLQLYDFIRR